jgi:hypothetical protein
MICKNLNTENSLMKFLGGHRGGVVSHFCLLKKQGVIEAAEISETLQKQGYEKLYIINEFCPFAMNARDDYEKCPWFNKDFQKK